jgi:hypothetical protein
VSDRDANLPHVDRRIGAHLYRVTRLPMGKWLDLQATVLRIAGPGLAEVIAGAEGSLADLGGVDVRSLAGAIREVAARATAAEQRGLLELLGDATMVEGDEGKWRALPWARMATWWPRYMAELVPFVAFGLEVQLADFFAGLVSAFGGTVRAREGRASGPDESQDTSSDQPALAG